VFDNVNTFLYDVPGGINMENEYTGLKVSTFRDRFSELCDSDPLNASAIADNYMYPGKLSAHGKADTAPLKNQQLSL
jgi:hypothetical protein